MNKLEITPDKQQIAAAGNPSLRLFDITTGSATSYDGHTNNVTAVGFQKDGKWFYTGSEDGTIKIVRTAATASLPTAECTIRMGSKDALSHLVARPPVAVGHTGTWMSA